MKGPSCIPLEGCFIRPVARQTLADQLDGFEMETPVCSSISPRQGPSLLEKPLAWQRRQEIDQGPVSRQIHQRNPTLGHSGNRGFENDRQLAITSALQE